MRLKPAATMLWLAPAALCTSLHANAQTAVIDYSTPADQICQQLGYDRVDQRGGTCGNVCGYCEGPTSCSAPGNKNFDGGGDTNFPELSFTVMWTCVNDP